MKKLNENFPRIKLVFFDMDGTLFENHLDWLEIRRELKIPSGGNILKEIYKDQRVDSQRLNILEKYESEHVKKTKIIEGVQEFLEYLKRLNIKTILITNNNRENTSYLLNKNNLQFDLIITREQKMWKPSPDAFIYVLNLYNCQPQETLSVGDSIYDIRASLGANIPLVLIIKNSKINYSDESRVIFFENYFELMDKLIKKDLLF